MMIDDGLGGYKCCPGKECKNAAEMAAAHGTVGPEGVDWKNALGGLGPNTAAGQSLAALRKTQLQDPAAIALELEDDPEELQEIYNNAFEAGFRLAAMATQQKGDHLQKFPFDGKWVTADESIEEIRNGVWIGVPEFQTELQTLTCSATLGGVHLKGCLTSHGLEIAWEDGDKWISAREGATEVLAALAKIAPVAASGAGVAATPKPIQQPPAAIEDASSSTTAPSMAWSDWKEPAWEKPKQIGAQQDASQKDAKAMCMVHGKMRTLANLQEMVGCVGYECRPGMECAMNPSQVKLYTPY